jgi:hypothetical protein
VGDNDTMSKWKEQECNRRERTVDGLHNMYSASGAPEEVESVCKKRGGTRVLYNEVEKKSMMAEIRKIDHCSANCGEVFQWARE